MAEDVKALTVLTFLSLVAPNSVLGGEVEFYFLADPQNEYRPSHSG